MEQLTEPFKFGPGLNWKRGHFYVEPEIGTFGNRAIVSIWTGTVIWSGLLIGSRVWTKRSVNPLLHRNVDSYLFDECLSDMDKCACRTKWFNNRWPDTVTWLKTSPLKGRAKSEQLSDKTDKIPDMLILIPLHFETSRFFDPSTSTGKDKLTIADTKCFRLLVICPPITWSVRWYPLIF